MIQNYNPTPQAQFAAARTLKNASRPLFSVLDSVPAPLQSAISEAERHRLVKGSKSPTSQDLAFTERFFKTFKTNHGHLFPKAIDEIPHFKKDSRGAGKFVVIGHRAWSDEYRIRSEITVPTKQQPPEQAGTRVTDILTENGARKIAESCEYMAADRGGYSTFLTLTFDEKQRARLERQVWDGVELPKPEKQIIKDHLGNETTIESETAGEYTVLDAETNRPYTPLKFKYETTIQKEISRFFDGLQKMYQRGWVAEIDGKKEKIAGSKLVPQMRKTKEGAEYCLIKRKPEKLDYCWVAEVPDKINEETGEVLHKNPHVHVLMRFKVPYRLFEAWAARIESLWGQGFAHLEKIKEGAKAGAYMAKAAGYLCKAQGKADQGQIRGNRYSISSTARAPDWVCVGRYELGRMGFLVAEAAEHFNDKFGYVKKRRQVLKNQLDKASGKQRHKIGALLEKTRATLKRMPRLSKFQAILKGQEQYNDFMSWAETSEPVKNHKWLPEKEEGEGFQANLGEGVWHSEFMRRRRVRKEKRQWSGWNYQGFDYYLYMLSVLNDYKAGVKTGRYGGDDPQPDYDLYQNYENQLMALN